ncbi:MAG: exodeoxyribonuclease VII small subunit [Bacteroidales bacterium]|jgi:exodeoxyribonuclease VII small subunit|nr:exodeoxyribonuclease VII small subunit [Bacteroidales bacterium]
MAKKKSYQEAYDELVTIVKELEEDTVSIDQMSEKVKKAAELIRICKEKLKVTEQEVTEILQELQLEETRKV